MTISEIEKIARASSILQNAKHAIAFTGAGISTDSGIPDFRSPYSGLWNNVDPLTVASLHGFRHNPQAFYKWVEPLVRTTLNAQPNNAHMTLARLEEAGRLKAVITQNIDMLHTRAGSKRVYELHGHLREATCIRCFAVYPAAPIIERYLADGIVPHCPDCESVLKPNVVLFGEALPQREYNGARDQARKADVVMVIGSSLEVAPACELPLLAVRNGAKLIVINLEPTPADRQAEVVIHANAALVLSQIGRLMETSV